MKKLFGSVCTVLCILLCLALLSGRAKAATVASGTCGAEGDNLIWTLDDQGTLTISGTGAMKDFDAPWYSNHSSIKTVVIENGVTTIGREAFSFCQGLTSVTIPNGVISIGIEAFCSCSALTSITIPDSVTTIGNWAFEYCTSLTTITIPDSVIFIGESAFSNTAWYNNQPDGLVYAGKVVYDYKGTCPSTITIKEGTLGIANFAFIYRTGLTSIIIPDSVTAIGDCAFYNCTDLTNLTIPDNVTTVGADAFRNTAWYDNQPDGLVYVGKVAYKYKGLHGATVAIKDDIVDIAPLAFYGYENLTSISIPRSIISIGFNAFFYCIGLKEILFEGAAPSFNSDIFYNVTATAYYPANDPSWTEAVRQGYGGDITWVAYEPVIEKFDIDLARMILGNSLEFQFGMAMSKMPDTTGCYAVVEKGDVTKTIPATQWGAVGPYYAIVYNGLAAKEMADEISVTIYNADGQAISNAKTDSVRAYVARAFDSQTAAGKTMMVDMLNYGAAAQQKFNYNTSDLANSQLTDAQKACGTATLTATQNIQAKGPNYVGTRLVLESRIQMQVAFSGMDRTMYAIYSYTDHNGTQKNVTVKGEDFIEVSGMYGIELSELVYADARSLVTVRVYNADGTLYSGAKDSIQSYVNRSGETDALFEALMRFTDSAKTYLHQ